MPHAFTEWILFLTYLHGYSKENIPWMDSLAEQTRSVLCKEGRESEFKQFASERSREMQELSRAK